MHRKGGRHIKSIDWFYTHVTYNACHVIDNAISLIKDDKTSMYNMQNVLLKFILELYVFLVQIR